MDAFTQGMLAAALFTSTDEHDQPLDRRFTTASFDPQSLQALERDAKRFQEQNADDLEGFESTQAGVDFWLTRTRSGAGYWDGDYPEPQASHLTKASKAFGEVELYVGDDNKIHASGDTMRFENPARSALCPVGTRRQSILFDRELFTPASAAAWAKSHDLKAPTPDIKENTIRLRQEPPEHFSSFHTITLTKGVQAVIGCPKPAYRKNPVTISDDTIKYLKVAGGVALLGTAGVFLYKATRKKRRSTVAAGALSAGTQTLIVQAPAGTTTQGLQTELAPVLGAVQAVPFTSIPLALENPNAAVLWSVTLTLQGPTTLAGLNALFAPIGVFFLGAGAPTIMPVQNKFSGTAGTPATLTIAATGSGTQPTIADVTAYVSGLGLANVTGSLTPAAVAPAGSPATAPTGQPAAGAQLWTVTGTPNVTGAFNDLTVSFGGASQSFSIQAAA